MAVESTWVVALGASGSDGLSDLRKIVCMLPATLNSVILVVWHRPLIPVADLAEILATDAKLPVSLAERGEKFVPRNIYVGEPTDHLALAARMFPGLVADPDYLNGNREVDLLFRSIVAHGGQKIVGAVLSGALDDGARGLAAIHRAGGITMVITPHTERFPGMPENAIGFDGPIDVIGDLSVIAHAIVGIVNGGD